MKLLGDKIIVRITKEGRESIFSKEITRKDGKKIKLFINVPALDDMDERKSRLFIQTGIVEQVSDKVKGIQVGDIALLDYQLCNSERNFVSKDDDGELYWLTATTTYHKDTLIANQTRRTKRDQIVHTKGDVNDLSMLLGIIRNENIIARRPYVFLENIPPTLVKTTGMGLVYQETQKVFSRNILAVDPETTKIFFINEGDSVMVNDADIFLIEFDGKRIDCIQDEDVLTKELV